MIDEKKVKRSQRKIKWIWQKQIEWIQSPLGSEIYFFERKNTASTPTTYIEFARKSAKMEEIYFILYMTR